MKAILSILCFLSALIAAASPEVSDSLSIIFPQSHSKIDPDLDKNRQRLDSMASALTQSALRITNVGIEGAASPEGPTGFNENLSRLRAKHLLKYLESRSLLPDSSSISFIGRNWKGLLAQVERDENVPARTEVLVALHNIISSISQGKPDSDANLQLIKNIANGAPYRYMYEHIFPSLRTSTLSFEYIPFLISIPDSIIPILPVEATLIDVVNPLPLPLSSMKSCRPFYMDVKTNLLYDALLLPNIGVDFYVGKNLSVGADWMYGWWSKNSRHRYWRAYGGDINLRWWFGEKAHEKPLTGHHLGLFAGAVTYDFELGGKGYMGGLPGENLWHRCNFISGIEYGYSLPVSRRLNIDFSLAVGYMGGRVIKYEPKGNGYEWQSTKHLHWFGPTKAEISLVWLIGCDNYNRKKGGEL